MNVLKQMAVTVGFLKMYMGINGIRTAYLDGVTCSVVTHLKVDCRAHRSQTQNRAKPKNPKMRGSRIL